MEKSRGDIVRIFYVDTSWLGRRMSHFQISGVADTNNVIGFAIGAMFVREVFHGEAKPQGMTVFYLFDTM